MIEKKKRLTRTGIGPFEIGVRTCSLRCTANLGLWGVSLVAIGDVGSNSTLSSEPIEARQRKKNIHI